VVVHESVCVLEIVPYDGMCIVAFWHNGSPPDGFYFLVLFPFLASVCTFLCASKANEKVQASRIE